MEYLASAERGKLKVKNCHCCQEIWIAGLRGSKAVRAAVGSATWSPLHQAVGSALPYLQQSIGITVGLPFSQRWKLETFPMVLWGTPFTSWDA